MLTVFWPTLNFLLFFIPGIGKKYWKSQYGMQTKLIKYTYFYPDCKLECHMMHTS